MALDHANIMRALNFAGEAHKGQLRKGTDQPYIFHPWQVGGAILQHTFDEDLAMAGFLHDTLEDTPVTLEQLRESFGDRIADIVTACSEPDKTLSWEDRKQHTIEYLRDAPYDIKVVACADKYHNILTMLEERILRGDELWQRFNRGKDQQEWYYRGLVESLGHGDFGSHGLYIYFRMAVECVFGSPDETDVNLMMTQLNWLRGQFRLGMLCFIDKFQNDVADLAAHGEHVQVMVANPIQVVIAFSKDLYETKNVVVGFIDEQENPLLLTDIEDRVCRFLDTYYGDLMNMVHTFTCANLGFLKDICEQENCLKLNAGHYRLYLNEDGCIANEALAATSQGNSPVSLVFDVRGELVASSTDLPMHYAQYFMKQLLGIPDLREYYVSARDGNSLSLSKHVELTPDLEWVPSPQ